jgi:hypothetical protein
MLLANVAFASEAPLVFSSTELLRAVWSKSPAITHVSKQPLIVTGYVEPASEASFALKTSERGYRVRCENKVSGDGLVAISARRPRESKGDVLLAECSLVWSERQLLEALSQMDAPSYLATSVAACFQFPTSNYITERHVIFMERFFRSVPARNAFVRRRGRPLLDCRNPFIEMVVRCGMGPMGPSLETMSIVEAGIVYEPEDLSPDPTSECSSPLILDVLNTAVSDEARGVHDGHRWFD